ncbi:aminotransferase class I/II-fold pyridoxal phosphate-dependent enzyme [Olivibacter domesticus]|uniref:Aminotransferase n=1 Tax=Olivibacter domesticus TaxID=407022 RepID=A0A1H7UZ36_OLID1|nr:aminotransferase class I/II-fold pyridoxal phosphate-dependent enzyme [Olivibacter domesticus]SEM02193.1 Histidinol-phosphate/aromatic aminotransferase or cobyric acid decarboxylase [Olivibacter domesticus]
MQAIILAAGMGKRLGELTRHNTKCMVKVNGVTLIDRLLTQLSNHKLSRVVIVTGYEGRKLQEYLGTDYQGTPIEYIDNPVYNKTNNIYSLFLAKDYLLKEETLLIESDLIFEDAIIDEIIKNPYPTLAAVAKYESWMDGTVVMLDKENSIQSFIPKKAFNYNDKDLYYKTVNIYKFSRRFSKRYYVPFLKAYSKALGDNEYYEQVLRIVMMIDKVELKALPLHGEKWYEIDDIQDLNNAETLFAAEVDKLSLYQKRYGGYWRFPKLKDFCYLVNPLFPPKRLKDELKANMDTLLTEYPSGAGVNRTLAGKYFSVNPDYITIGNGAAELISAYLSHHNVKTGVVFPTFEEYPNRLKKENIVAYYPANADFSYSAKDLISYFEEHPIKQLLLINPDNPSGNFLRKEEVEELLQWTLQRKIKLLYDESFIDFAAGYFSMLSDEVLKKYPNLVVVKSISKSYGVPGLRLGVMASADQQVVQSIQSAIAIWNINSFAEFYLQIFGKYESDYYRACKEFLTIRDKFHNKLKTIKFLRVIPSSANYFLCEVKEFTSLALTEKLLLKNILIKDCSTKAGFNGQNFVRIAIRNKEDNNLLIKALRELSL